MINLLKLLPWIAFIVGHAFFDFYRIKKDDKPIYLQSFIIRGMVAIAHVVIFFPYTDHPFEWWPLLIFQVTSFWLIFPLLLNGLRRKPALYVGAQSGWMDEYFLNHPINQWIAKAAALTLMVLSTIVIYQK